MSEAEQKKQRMENIQNLANIVYEDYLEYRKKKKGEQECIGSGFMTLNALCNTERMLNNIKEED